MNSERIRALQAFVAWTSLKVIAGLLAIFVVVRVAIPDLINAHNDALALAAVALGIAAVAGAGWLAFAIWLSITRFRQSRTDLLPPPNAKGQNR